MKRTIDVANVLLQNSSGEVLLLQRAPRLKRPYIWGLPGGMIDTGESALVTASRELLEESGIEESEIIVHGLMKFLVQMPDENVHITNVHASLLEDTTAIKPDPDEHIAYRWASPEDIYVSSDLLPCVPTMIARILGMQNQINDRTITSGIQVKAL